MLDTLFAQLRYMEKEIVGHPTILIRSDEEALYLTAYWDDPDLKCKIKLSGTDLLNSKIDHEVYFAEFVLFCNAERKKFLEKEKGQ